jgi:HSP20 family molecular chaperone IbpA
MALSADGATYEDMGFQFVAGGLHPDHDTFANFRKTFLPELEGLFVQILLLAQLTGVLKVGNLSLDGSKIHADASKTKAASYGRLKELETTLREEVVRLFEMGEQADQGDVELPGVEAGEVELSVVGETITLSGERPPLPELKAAGTRIHRQERGSGRFVRSIELPFPVQADKVDARLEKGVLHLHLPKAGPAHPQKISIQSE